MSLPIIMLVVMVGMMFFMQRQQKKQAQERQKQLNAVQKGDEIVTIGGLFGVVDEVNTEAQRMVLDVHGVYLTFELAAIKSVVSKAATPTEPVEDVKIIEVNEDENKETAIETE